MTSTETTSPSPPPGRPLKIRRPLKFLLLGSLIVAVLVVVFNTGHRQEPEPIVSQDAKADPAVRLNRLAQETFASMINSFFDDSRDALKKGDLLSAFDYQQWAASLAGQAVKRWPDNQDFQPLARRSEEIIFEYEKYGGADPPGPGRTANKPDRYPEEAAGPIAAQVNDLFVAGWASLGRNQTDTAVGNFKQALNLLDELLNPGQRPDQFSGPRHSAIAVPPQPVERIHEISYLRKYYAIMVLLADLESKAGHPGQAEAVRRRALAAIDQALARGADVAELNEYLDPLLAYMARAERRGGRLESARLTLQRRLGLAQYMLTHLTAGQSPAATQPAATTTDRGTLRADHTKMLLELAWLDRHTFHYDEGLEYVAELLNASADQPQSAASAETGRRAWLIRGEMLMDLGRFQEAEPALRTALAFQPIDGSQPDEALATERRRVTDIKANLALAELRLAQGDPQAAGHFMEEAVALYRVLPGGSPVTFDVQLVRVKVLARRGDSQRAERELAGFLAGAPALLASPEVDIWTKRQILALMAEAAWQARARGEMILAIEHYRRVNDELTPYITGIEVDKASEYGSLFRPILVEIMEGEGDLRADLRQMSEAESCYALGLDMARTLRNQEPRQYFWRALFTSLATKVERFHY